MVTSKLKVRKASVITLFSITCNFLTRERGYKLYYLYTCFHSFVKRQMFDLSSLILWSHCQCYHAKWITLTFISTAGFQLQRLQGHSSGGKLLYLTGLHSLFCTVNNIGLHILFCTINKQIFKFQG